MESNAHTEPTLEFTPDRPADTAPAASTDLNAVQAQVVGDQASFGDLRHGRPNSLFVDNEGNILLRRQAEEQPVRVLSRVTTETFYAPDLNRIAETIRANQQSNRPDPSRRDMQLFVDKEGDIMHGDQVNPQAAARVSRVTQETFYAGRREQEETIVRSKFPANTYPASDGAVEGWVYQIVTEFNDPYTMFLWFDSSDRTYKVSLVEPRLGGTVGVEECHLYPDGTICLKRQGGPGYSNMADAYARSVLWTRGASCYRRGYGFQFNVGQAG